jgi:membrane protease subunit HflK
MTLMHTHEPEPVDTATPPEGEGSKFARAHHILLYFVAAVLVVWLLTGFYQVKTGEIAIVERMGQYLASPTGKAIRYEQGLHYHLPWPIDIVHKVSVQQVAPLRVDEFNTTPARYAEFRQSMQQLGNRLDVISALFNPYLITADRNVVHMDVTVYYRVNDPEAWLNTISHATNDVGTPDDLRQQIFQQITQRAMIARVAQMTLEQVLFTGQEGLRASLQEAVQNALVIEDPHHPHEKQSLGVEVVRLDLVTVRAPDRVKSAFDMVQQARTNKESTISTAEGMRNSMIQRATAERETLQTNASRDAIARVSDAAGEVARFTQVLQQYQNSPDTTRFDIFADTASTILKNARRTYTVLPGTKVTVTVDPPQYDANQVAPR